MRTYEYRHVIGFEETNLVGNVYYVNPLRWQGRCREMFLRDHVPQLAEQLTQGLCLVTLRCSCEFLAELVVFDEVVVRMRLVELIQNRITLGFDYCRITPDGEELVARGEQQIATMRRAGTGVLPERIPSVLMQALQPYTGG